MRRRKYLVEVDVKLMSIHESFDITNNARLRNFSGTACNTSAQLEVSSALGALGREFESLCPEKLFSDSQKPPWEKFGENKKLCYKFY